MHLKEIVLEGFKSYAVRTLVSGFDREFNAITGLNGSGKSNILDSICFVLGISNLTQVRAANLQELVYKQGQAGVQKATVTLVFDNEDKENSPLGYEQNTEITVTRQVVIGGRNKYLINGHTAQLNQVQNLFHSVQLNVNNPHFLIMQGRITKVLNMKPPEILGMLEEAAGTRLFEQKKDAALKTIEKKSRKVEEISTVLTEEISPKLEKLRGERAGYMKWSSNNTEIERLERYSTAYDFHQAERTRAECDDKVKAVRDELEALQAENEESLQVVATHDTQIAELTQSKEQEMGSEFKEIEHQVTEKSKKMVKHTSAWQNKKEAYEKEVQGCAGMHDGITEAGKQLEAMAASKATAEEKRTEAQTIADDANAAAEEMQRKYLAGELSVDDGQGQNGSLADQLEQSKATVTSSTTNAKQLETKIKHLRKELDSKQKAEGKGKKEYAKLLSEQQKLENDLKTITIKLMELDYDEAQEQSLLTKKAEIEQVISQLQEKVDQLSSRLSRIQFDYSDPTKNFDRSKVKGLVAELLELKDPSTSTALEVTAGGALYSVVVDTDTTGKLLLKNGKLKKRISIIPLNKIDTRGSIPDAKLKAAEKTVGKTNVSTALSLVEYEPEVEPAMKHVFGKSFVCRDSKTAREVTFNEKIKTRSVTLDGDVFQPSGMLSGGSRPQTASVLERLQALTAANKELEQQQQLLARIDEQLATVQQSAAEYRALKNEKEMKTHETELIKQRIAASAHQQQQAELQTLENELNSARESLVAAFEEKKNAEARCKDLQNSIKNFEKDRARQMKEIEATVAKSKKDAATASKKAKAAAQKVESIELEIAETEKEILMMKEQVKEREAALAEAAAEVAELETQAAARKQEYEEAKHELDSRRQRISDCEKEIVKLAKGRNSALKKAEKADLEAKRVAHKVTRMEKDSDAAARLIAALLVKFPWIESEKHLFGQPKSEYDFSRRSPEAAREKLVELHEEQDKLSKKINKKVMSMFEKAEQEYQDLMQRKSIIENDKDKIEKVITELDTKKNETLKKTWAKVNRDFGSIFSTLLPGANAKLEPEEGKSVLDGLCVCVALGNVWKESLTELSGGQRSLLALSLVLSLLLFKPAPMYILDEVDAALDLSHTQNIGAMIKNHFKHSQFIVVSLKEGMFQNANVIFRTKFVDGVSTVTRTTNVGAR